MSLASHVVLFAVSLALLAKSADWLVDFGTRVAKRLNVSDLIIGLTLTSVGTSVPELAASISASVQGNSGLIMGNIIGSNIANIGLIAGVAALVKPFATERRMHDRDGLILLAVSVGFFVMVLDNHVGRWDAAILLGFYLVYIGFAARTEQAKIEHQFRYFLSYLVSLDYVRPLVGRLKRDKKKEPRAQEAPSYPTKQLVLEILAIVGSCAGVVIGARYVVQEASWTARAIGVPESVIGLSLVAVGTSLPELMVAIAAAQRGNAAMVVGNVMGSNLANLLFIMGTSAAIRPLEVQEISVVYTVPIMLFFTLALLYFVRTGWRITRIQGFLALASYCAFMAAAFIYGWS